MRGPLANGKREHIARHVSRIGRRPIGERRAVSEIGTPNAHRTKGFVRLLGVCGGDFDFAVAAFFPLFVAEELFGDFGGVAGVADEVDGKDIGVFSGGVECRIGDEYLVIANIATQDGDGV